MMIDNIQTLHLH